MSFFSIMTTDKGTFSISYTKRHICVLETAGYSLISCVNITVSVS